MCILGKRLPLALTHWSRIQYPGRSFFHTKLKFNSLCLFLGNNQLLILTNFSLYHIIPAYHTFGNLNTNLKILLRLDSSVSQLTVACVRNEIHSVHVWQQKLLDSLFRWRYVLVGKTYPIYPFHPRTRTQIQTRCQSTESFPSVAHSQTIDFFQWLAFQNWRFLVLAWKLFDISSSFKL